MKRVIKVGLSVIWIALAFAWGLIVIDWWPRPPSEFERFAEWVGSKPSFMEIRIAWMLVLWLVPVLLMYRIIGKVTGERRRRGGATGEKRHRSFEFARGSSFTRGTSTLDSGSNGGSLGFASFTSFIILCLLQSGVFEKEARADDTYVECRPQITGNAGAWSPWIKNAKRNARMQWRRAVRSTPMLGKDYDNWDLAEQDLVYECGEVGYCCTDKKVWGVVWHRCSASARPCIMVPAEREEREAAITPRRTTPLQISEVRLDAVNLDSGTRCPRIVVLSVLLTGTGESGAVDFRLRGDSDAQRASLSASDFETKLRDGTRRARYDFVREFNEMTVRDYQVELLGRHRGESNTARVNVRCSNNPSPGNARNFDSELRAPSSSAPLR